MSKKLLISFFVILLAAAAGHSAFWFYKAGQLEKYVNNFILKNSKNISVASFDVSGFPLNQTITIRGLKFSAPNSVIDGNKILIQKTELTSKVFENIFNINLSGNVTVFDEDNKVNNLELNQKPEAQIVIADNRISKFSYKDSGYRIFDAERQIIYRSSSNKIDYKSKLGDSGKIDAKFHLEMKEVEGFNIVDIYQNSFEDKVMDEIKTGTIVLGSSVAKNFIGNQFSIALDKEVVENIELTEGASIKKEYIKEVVESEADVAAQEAKEEAAKSDEIAKEEIKEIATKEVAKRPEISETATMDKKEAESENLVKVTKAEIEKAVSLAKKEETAAKLTAEAEKVEIANPQIEASNKEEEQISAEEEIAKADALKQVESLIEEQSEEVQKNDITLDVEYSLIPSADSKSNMALPMDPSQMQIVEAKYNKVFTINKAQIKNSKFDISVNGKINQFQDDVKLSGYSTVKINNVANLIKFLEVNLNKLADNKNSELDSFDASSESTLSEGAYQDFLRKIAMNLGVVLPEIANKNQLSTEDVAVLEFRREKNLELVVNETSTREILGKF